MFSVFLILAVALIGGLIAFVGDRVGMRVGRKRLSFMGLRPKYTSMIIAVLTGVLTAAVTLGILSIASENVRVAVFHLGQLRNELQETTVKNQDLKTQVEEVQRDLDDKTEQWNAAKKELENVNTTISALDDKISALTADRERVEQTLQVARDNLQLTADDLASVKKQYEQISQELQDAQDAKAKAEEDLEFTEQRKTIAEQSLALVVQQMSSMKTQMESLGEGVVDFAHQQIIIHLGEVLAARVIQPGTPNDQIEELVQETVLQADEAAKKRGATIENKDFSSKVDVTGWANALLELMDLKEPAVLRVVSKTNSIAGKPAFIMLEVLPNTVIFRQGDVVAETKIKSDASPDDVIACLVDDLLPQARQAVADQGMVGADGEVPSPAISLSDLDAVAEEAGGLGSQITCRLVAAEDLQRVCGDLKLNISVSRDGGTVKDAS